MESFVDFFPDALLAVAAGAAVLVIFFKRKP